MIWFLLIIVGMVWGSSLLFNEYPQFLIKQIFEKCRKNQFDFLRTPYPFLSPKKFEEILAVKNYGSFAFRVIERT